MLDLFSASSPMEGSRLEEKAAQGGLPRSLWATYSAFANTDGGTILLGVSEMPDKRLEVVGVPDPQRTRKEFWDALNGGQVASPNILSDDDVTIASAGGSCRTTAGFDMTSGRGAPAARMASRGGLRGGSRAPGGCYSTWSIT